MLFLGAASGPLGHWILAVRAVAVFACIGGLLAGGAVARVDAQEEGVVGTPVVEFVPSLLQLGGVPVRIVIRVSQAPPTQAFEIEISYDAAIAIVTAVEPGGFLSSVDGLAELEVREAEPGRLVLAGEIPSPPEAPEGEDAVATPVDGATFGDAGSITGGGSAGIDPVTGLPLPETAAILPSGEGVLALVTFAALAKSEGSQPITIAEATLRGADGAVIDAEVLEAQMTVVEDPSPEARAEAEAQAAALAEEAASNSGLAGAADSIAGAYSDLERKVLGFGSDMAPQFVWLGVLGLALAVVGLAWYFGRRPVDQPGAGQG
jgi:hypothetical protein